MKRLLFVLLVLAISVPCDALYARRDKSPKRNNDASIEKVAPVPMPEDAVMRVEVMPKCKFGELPEFRKWVAGRLKCPKSVYTDLKALGYTEKAVLCVMFFVDVDGTAKFVETRLDLSHNFAKFENAELDEALARIIASGPQWSPAMQGGEPKRVQFMMPLTIEIW